MNSAINPGGRPPICLNDLKITDVEEGDLARH